MQEKPSELQECPFSYDDDDDDIQKQHDMYRVFWTSGPELSNVSLLLPPMPVDVGRQVALRATAGVDGTNGFGGKLSVEFQWTGRNVSYVERHEVPTNHTAALESVWLTSFPEEGGYEIFVRLLNGARTLSLKSWLTARPPIPGDLRLTLRTPATPNCVPTHLCHNRSAILVFAGLPVLLEAFLLVSSKDKSDTTTFRWVVSSQDTRQVALETGTGATGSTREITFPSEGLYTVEVVMTTPDGNVNRDQLNVISVERTITNLTVVLDPETGPLPYSLELVLTFLVSFETTDPSQVQLFFDYGDNSSITLPPYTVDWTLGSGCHVGFRLQHRYRHEGEFLPRVQAKSSPSHMSETTLGSPVRVYRPLETVTIEAEEFHPAGEVLEFLARPVQESENTKDYHWELRRDGESVLVAGETSKSPLLKVQPLNRTGKYDLRVTVTNPLGSVSAKRVFTVLERVGGLKIRSSDKKRTVSIGETRIFRARYDSGSDVTCRWRVSPVCRSCVIIFRGCEARVTFDLAGRWSVSVEARNSIGAERTQLHISVQEQIQDLHVAVEPPNGVVYAGAAITILASVLKGSEVEVRVKFPGSDGDGVVAKLDSRTERFVTTQKLKRTGKNQEVIVESFNKVSHLTRRIAVTVRRKMKSVRFKPLGCVSSNAMAVFTAKTRDSKKGDLYFWKIANNPPIISSVPYATLTFPKPGFNLVKLMVRRGAQDRRARIRIFVNSSCPLSLLHEPVIEVGKKATFALKGLPPDAPVKVIYLPDPEVHRLTSNSVTGQLTWRHVFQSLAVVVVKVTAERNNISVVSAVQVQSSPTAVTLSGPKIVHIWSLPVASTWEAHVQPPETSGLVFQWSVGHSRHLSSSRKFTTSLAASGQHEVQVTAWNHLGKVSANLTVLAVVAISSLKLSAQPTPYGRASTITLIIRGQPEFSVSLNFGDSTSTSATTFTVNKKDPTSFKSVISHHYSQAGHYKVVANVSNYIGWLSTSTIAAVEDPIVDVILELGSPALVALFQEVVVEAKVGGGSWPEFLWDFGDDSDGEYTNVESDASRSIAHHSYGTAGTYIVKLVVKNAVSSVHSELSTPIKAMEPIEGLRLQPLVTGVYAAALSFGSHPTTTPVQFEAHVWRGSDVEFHFDFGDGHQQSVSAVVNMRSIAAAIGSHIYMQKGTYHVRVTAQNPLGKLQTSLDRPFSVQFPPRNLSFSYQYYVTRNGKPVNLKVSLSRGTNVSFQWWIDGKFYKNHTDHNLTLTFPHAGTYKIKVQAHNLVSVFENCPEAETRVYVQEILTGVQMKLQLPNNVTINEGESAILATDESILVDVAVIPHSQLALRFLWDLGVGELRRTNQPRLQYAYRNSGRYSMCVTAQNHVSEISSGNISLYLIQKVGNRTSIQHPGTSSIGQSITFQALYSSGSDLMFEWDFGDGSAIQVSTFRKAVHIYKELGEFWIILNIWNAFSSATIKSNIFILEKPCEKPKLSLIATSEAGIEVDYSSPVTVEVDLSTSCSLTSGIDFLWIVKPLPEGISTDMLHHRDLILAAHLFPVGHYKLSLMVTMRGTIVYEMVETDLKIQASHPTVALSGGILRTVSRNEIVHINSTTDIDIQGVRYEWHCLGLHNHPCFAGKPTPPELYKSNITSFNFPANWLYHGGVEFQVTLILGQERYSTSQVLEVHPNTSVAVECLNCKRHTVNSNTRLVFKAHCSTCEQSSIQYTWKLWLIQDGHHLGNSDGYICVKADGSISYLLNSQETLEMKQKETVEVFEKAITGTNNSVATVLPITTTDSTNVRANLVTPKTIPIFTEEKNVYKSKDMDAFPEFDNPEHFHTNEEGLPGEGGSAGSRIHIFQTSERKPYFDEENSTRLHGEKRPDPRNPVRDENSVVDIVPRITSRPRVFVPLSSSQTSTGIHMQHLVIRDGVLRPGSHYLVQVSVAGSTAMEYIQVLRGPEKGRCHVKPSFGIELETAFRLHCLEWKSHQLPIYYSLEYTLYPDVQALHTIYKGLNTNAKFILPAGLLHHNRTVYLKVTVENASGATTNVCIVKCTVLPMNISVAHDSDKFNITTNSRLNKLIAEKNTQAALHYLHVLATALVQHENLCSPQLIVILISVFEKLEYRNPITVKQALSSLSAVLNTPTKLDPDDVRALVKLLEYFGHHLHQVQNIPDIVLNTVSLILQKAVHLHLEDCVVSLRRLIVSIQSAYLKQIVPSEIPLTITANDLTVSVGYINHLPMSINTSQVTIILSQSTRSRRSPAIYPFIVMSEVYLYDPFPNEMKLTVQTTVQVNATIPALAMDVLFKKQMVDESPNPLFMLHQNTVNIHQLNISGHLYLSVFIHFLGKNASRDFPVQVFIGKAGAAHWFQQVYTSDEMQIRIFIPPSQIPVFFTAEKRQVELTLLCARNKCHRMDKRWRIYQIRIWEQQCLFRQDEHWTQNICHAQETADPSAMYCRCPHVGTVGVEVQAVGHDVKEVSIEQVYRLEYKSSATVLLVLSLLVYFIFLPWCYKADIRNTHKPPIIPLEDNRTWESYNYIVTVQTGNYWASGTTAAVFMALHGNKDLSATKCLTGQLPHHYLQRSSVDHFIFSTKMPLGELWKLQVWHNNTGANPSWYLKCVTITDPSTGRNWQFECNQWLAVEDDDGEIEKEFLVSETSWKRCSLQSILDCICEFHLWSSVLLSPSNSPLSHSQRLMCCLITAISNAALTALAFSNFWQIPSNLPIDGTPWPILQVASVVSGCVFGVVLLVVLVLRWISPTTPECYLPTGTLPECLWPDLHCPLQQKETSQGSDSLHYSDSYDSPEESSYYSVEESEGERSAVEFELEDTLSHWCEIENWARRKHEQRQHGYYDKPLNPANALDKSAGAHRIQKVEETTFTQCSVVSYVVWTIMVTLVVLLIVLVTLLARKLDDTEVIYWLQSWFLGLVCDAFLFQPLLVMFVALLRSPKNKTIPPFKKHISLEGQHRSDEIPYYRPPSESYLIKARCKTTKIQLAFSVIIQSLTGIVILVLLVIIICDEMTRIHYAQTVAVKNALARPRMDTTVSLNAWRQWIQHHFQETDYWHATGSILIGQLYFNVCLGTTDCHGMEYNTINNISVIWPRTTKSNFTSVLQYLLLNPAYNLFTYVAVSIEFPYGEVATLIKTCSPWSTSTSQARLLVEAILVLISVWMLKTEIWRFLKLGRKYISDGWNYVQLTFCGLVLSHLFATSYRYVLAEDLLQQYHRTGKWEPIIRFRDLATWDWAIRALQGGIVFVHLCGWLKMMKLNPRTGRAVAVIESNFREILGLWVLWLMTLLGYAISINLLSGLPYPSVVSCIITGKQCLQTPDTHFVSFPIRLVAAFLFFLTLGLVIATLNASRRNKDITDNLSSLTWKEMRNLMKEQLYYRFGWPLNLAKEQKRTTDTKPISASHRPLEFILFDLDTKIDKLMQATDSLFVAKDAELPMEDVVPVIFSSNEKPPPKETTSSESSICRTTLTKPNSSKAANARNRVRKTRPLRVRNSISSTSSEDIVFPRTALRKTKSRGKGKNKGLQLQVPQCSDSSVYM